MNFTRHMHEPALLRIDLTVFINLALLLASFVLIITVFVSGVPLYVKLPKAVTSDMTPHDSMMVKVTSENILYVNDRVTTLRELRMILEHRGRGAGPLLIQADRRASVGRLVELWDLGRSLGLDRINIATDQEL